MTTNTGHKAQNIFMLVLVSWDGTSSTPIPFASKQLAQDHAQRQCVKPLVWAHWMRPGYGQGWRATVAEDAATHWRIYKQPLIGELEQEASHVE